MKKAISIIFILLFSTFCFSEIKPEQCRKDIVTFYEKGTCLIIINKENNNFAVVQKSVVTQISIVDEKLIVLYAFNNTDTFDCKLYNFYLDKDNNFVISSK